MKKTLAAAALAAGMACLAKADDRTWASSPIGVGIAAPIQVPYVETDIRGFRFGGLFGWNADMVGLDLGVASLETGEMRGLQLSAFSWTCESVYGLQLSGLANVADGNVFGWQNGAFNVDLGEVWGLQIGVVDYCNSFHGWQIGGLNWNNTPSHGWQVGAANADQEEFTGFSLGGVVNFAPRMTGCQIGAVNVADSMTGVQIGFFNAVQRMRGLQIGAVNIICDGMLPIMVIVNASF